MSIWVILMEMIVYAAIFTAIIFIYYRGDRKYSPASIHNYPPDIQEEYFKTHEQVDVSYKSKNVILTKSFGVLLFTGILLVCALVAGAKTFWQFFLRFVLIFTIYKICDMTLIDNFLLLEFHFFQHYYPEAAQVMEGRKYGFNIVSQLLKLFVIFPAVSALAAWICSMVL